MMQPLHRTQADEQTTLAMENELLRHEVTHLRARLAAAEAEVVRRSGEKAEAPAAGEGTAADDARNDLAWLLRRIESTPAALVLRRRDGYRRLVDTYLGEGDG